MNGVISAYPGVCADLQRVVAENDNTIVVEYKLVNASGDTSERAWRLDGPVCEIFEISDGRILRLRSYYAPTETDRTGLANVPSRAEAARIERAVHDKVAVLVVPIAFVSEHSETLVELDIEYRHLADKVGVPTYIRVPTVGTHPLFIAGLARLVRDAL